MSKVSSSSSIRRSDILSLSNLRQDGRKPNELRHINIQLGPLHETETSASGSAMIEMGLTSAVAVVQGPTDCPRRSDELNDRACLDVQLSMAPFALAGGDRRVTNANSDRKLLEQSSLVQKALEATILLHLYPKCQIIIQICILADDGGRLCAAINAASLALMDAGIPMKDFLCACSAGHAGGTLTDTTLVDLTRREEAPSGGQVAVSVPCAMLPQRGSVVMAQCDARLPNYDAMETILQAAMDGCRAVFEIMQEAVRERASNLIRRRAENAPIEYAFS